MRQSKNHRTVFAASIEKGKPFPGMAAAHAGQRGSILIGLIVTMVVMAALGASMVYLTTTSTFQELLANNHARATYAAESGGRYANALIRQSLATGQPVAFNALETNYFNSPYTLANGDQFEITYWTPTTVGGSMNVTYDSVGTAGSGFLQAKVRLRYRVNPADQQSGTGGSGPPPEQSALPRPASDFDIPKQDLDIYYSPVDMSQVDIKDNPYVQSDRALNLKADYYVMGLKWYANPAEMLQFDQIRAANGGLLNYRAQVKMLDNNKDHSNMYNIIGISFRLDDTNTSAMTTDTAYPDMYGISFLKLPGPWEANINANKYKNAPDWFKQVIHPEPSWNPVCDYNWYIVLWKRTAGITGQHKLLAYQKLTNASWACSIGTATNCTEIKDWSTIYVDVEERIGIGSADADGFNYSNGVRYNVIKSYMQGGSAVASPPGPYLRSTTASPQDIWWEDDDTSTAPVGVAAPIFQPAGWTLVSGSGAFLKTGTNIIADASKTTLNYDNYTTTTTPKAREVGLHIYNVRTNAQNIFYDNFYIDLSPSGGTGSGLVDGTGQVVVSP